MSNLCPNCGQLTNATFSRLVKDTCGHLKCRMCLLYEEQGCESCRKNSNDFEYIDARSETEAKSPETNLSNVDNSVDKPLQLVVNKNPEFYLTEVENTSEPVQETNSTEENTTFNQNNDEPKTLTELKQVEMNRIEFVGVETDEMVYQVVTEKKIEEKKTNKYHNRNHIIDVPGQPGNYQCVICQKVFQNKKCIHYHNACATGVKPFQCKLCDKSFINRSHFEYHERTHTGFKPFKCHLCDKAFPQRNKLNRHMRCHTNEKNFACSKCDKRYSKKADLQSHLRIHTGKVISKLCCKTCGKTYGNITHLKRHSQVHSNERPHVCEHCNKGFKDKSLLLRHHKTHEKSRPFTCAHCSRGFLTKSELRRHLAIHTGEKPFSCTFCQTVFRRKDNLTRHIRHHHSEEERAKIQQQISEKASEIKKAADTEKSSVKVKRKSKSKNKKIASKSENKAVKIAFTNSQKQINSRLDPMGNITPVIRTTGEVSNAVPVINGPTISRRYTTESNDQSKKTLTYMEPIPPEEAVVINKRIEAKLYPQSNISQNYFFHEFSDPNDNLSLNTSSLLRSSLSFSNRSSKYKPNFYCDAVNGNDMILENSSKIVPDKHKASFKFEEEIETYEEKVHYNYVSTIKKHIVQNNT